MKRFEPYFNRWIACIAIACEEYPQGTPLYEHRTCKQTVTVVKGSPAPPRICPNCGVDCVKEQIQFEKSEAEGAVLLDAPQTFPGIINYS